MPYYVVSDLGLHCLPITLLGVYSGLNPKIGIHLLKYIYINDTLRTGNWVPGFYCCKLLQFLLIVNSKLKF